MAYGMVHVQESILAHFYSAQGWQGQQFIHLLCFFITGILLFIILFITCYLLYLFTSAPSLSLSS